MVSFKSLLVASMAFTLALASPSSPLEKRASVKVDAYNTGDCKEFNTTVQGESGECYNFNHASFGATYEVLDGATCTFKAWEGENCTGKATVRVVQGRNLQCVPIANDSNGQFHLVAGARSIRMTCT